MRGKKASRANREHSYEVWDEVMHALLRLVSRAARTLTLFSMGGKGHRGKKPSGGIEPL